MKITEKRKVFGRWIRAVAMVGLLIPWQVCVAQTIVQGATKTQGAAQVNSPYSRYVQIEALFPPAWSSFPNSDYANFRSDVMNQASIDGATLSVVWSSVETGLPSTASCGAASDTCQQDSVGLYHSYDWSAYDSPADASHTRSLLPWFDRFPPTTGLLKKVNLILSGINGGAGVNSSTPWYVTEYPTYLANFSPSSQDVLNAAKDCAGIPWKGVTTANFARFDASTVQVTLTGCCKQTATTLHDGDTVWVYAGNPGAYNGQFMISRVDDDHFKYAASVPSSPCGGCTYISAGQSSPVPYEAPYVAAWQAFVAAAHRHFNPNYTPIVGGTTLGAAGTNQLGYIRSGTWSGGESFVYCITNGAPGTGLSGLSGSYAYYCDLHGNPDCSSTPGASQSNSNNIWLKDYSNKINYVQSLAPTLPVLWPVDPIASDVSYPNTMTADAVAGANGAGDTNGFGSQGLSAADYQPGGSGCSTSNANWCTQFTNRHSSGMPLQLQQISLSDETQSCSTAGACGTPPKSAGDMRLWLPFAVSNYATILEVYYLDLALAYDTNYCPTNDGTQCTSGYQIDSIYMVDATKQFTWYNQVGRGNSSCTSGTTDPNCYSAIVDAAHGPH